MQTCRKCHENIYTTFIETGMGKSFEVASKQKSSAIFSTNNSISDNIRNFKYHALWHSNDLFIKEFRLNKKDTVYQRNEKVDYIIGSGQHTNSHISNTNGYLHQMPMTFYTQKKEWHLPPGFENGYNTRFERPIGLECMSCHNSYPEFVKGSENKFVSLPNGIGCERCHGPGGAHVAAKTQGIIIDTSKYIDYTIVNPAKLPINLQFDVCQRCHLQGNAVLKNDKSFYDFKPGQNLSNYISVFLPKFENSDNEFIMASHADRLKKSKCFIVSNAKNENNNTLRPHKNGLTCVSCHNPHVSVKATQTTIFNNTCKRCHTALPTNNCTMTLEQRTKQNNNNCVQCHLPKSGSIDIPHVTVHDHWIRKPIKENEVKKLKKFIGLFSINEKKPAANTVAKAYLQQFEKFNKDEIYLDSAYKYINKSSKKEQYKNLELLVHYHFLKNNYSKIIELINSLNATTLLQNILIKESLQNSDAWTCYRIAESFTAIGDNTNAQIFLNRGVKLAPFILEFRLKLGNSYFALQKINEAQFHYEFIVKENPKHAKALGNLGYIYLMQNKTQKAIDFFDKALLLDPDYEIAKKNKVLALKILENNN
jgi:hypothetical protein